MSSLTTSTVCFITVYHCVSAFVKKIQAHPFMWDICARSGDFNLLQLKCKQEMEQPQLHIILGGTFEFTLVANKLEQTEKCNPNRLVITPMVIKVTMATIDVSMLVFLFRQPWHPQHHCRCGISGKTSVVKAGGLAPDNINIKPLTHSSLPAESSWCSNCFLVIAT